METTARSDVVDLIVLGSGAGGSYRRYKSILLISYNYYCKAAFGPSGVCPSLKPDRAVAGARPRHVAYPEHVTLD